MTRSLNVIALISGGKDSLYTLLHCIQNGHRVVALANLYPAPQKGTVSDAIENEDINSFMYQTVGHNAIPLYADALQLPLYRQQIRGTLQQTERDYDPSLDKASLDETEDLVPLLENVMKHHPEADAVCSGAILSTYQRTRIESVALRLGLTPLAYLWQYPFLPPSPSRLDSLTGLLEDMSAAGCDSRVVKIASGGLPEDLLGTNVAHVNTMNRLVSCMAPYLENDEPALRGAVLGEGGEFETLALDGPRSVWKSKIEIMEQDNSVISEEGGVKWLKIGRWRLVEQATAIEDSASSGLVRVPRTLDPQLEYVAAVQLNVRDKKDIASQGMGETPVHTFLPYEALKALSVKLSLESHTLSIANMTASNLQGTAARQMDHIVLDLKRTLLHLSEVNNINPPLSSAAIIFSTILLVSMSSFPSVNASYAQLFSPGLPNPPARVTIACSLPPNILVSLSCTISLLPRNTYRGLHVQSQSYWAPANIGPYSQAICVPCKPGADQPCKFVHVAGQIPLIPASMEILSASFMDQALLALQHLWRVGQERGVDLWTWGVAFLPRLDESDVHSLPQTAAAIWKQAHLTTVQGESVFEEPEDMEDDESAGDAWDIKYNRMQGGRAAPTVGQHRHVLPNTAVIANVSDIPWIPPIIVPEVEELPRSAPVEWHSHGLGRLPKRPSSTPRISTDVRRFPWGAASVCSYKGSKQSYEEDDSDGDSHRTSHSEHRNYHFVTVQVFQAAMLGNESSVPTLTAILGSVLPSRSAKLSNDQADHGEKEEAGRTTGPEDRLSCVFAVAYIAGVHGEAALAVLGGLEVWPGSTLIPCRRLWGDCHQIVMPGLEEIGLTELGLAVSLRIDDNAECSE